MSSLPAAAIVLQRLHYAPLPTPFVNVDVDPAHAAGDLAMRVGAAAAAFEAESTEVADDYFIGSTLGSHYLSDPDSTGREYKAEIGRHAKRPVDAAVNVYECTNWAFLLREGLDRSRRTGLRRRLLMQVVDCDIHGIEAAWRTRTYGNAQFGILNLDVVVDAKGLDSDIAIDVAPLSVSMLKFGSRLRSRAAALTCVVSPPFFPEATSAAFRKTLRGVEVLREHHVQFGHCFGADPWIGLGLGHHGQTARYVVGSLALNGYHAISTITVAADARLEVSLP
ncbi:hypothetical protein NYR97_11550 [Xanthomonas hydrangeae]|uniref:Uncharacterized protein n=1 Tax=Xanthomonas hydrangeae TaxID=2775159 RepID=A0AAU0B6V6_9XANT|nr:hypothetical protein [Xanthomonas hydrangeae]WOB47928.1 hypothetical protein NYR97_11550 [Xanthomonas hydrangeae]